MAQMTVNIEIFRTDYLLHCKALLQNFIFSFFLLWQLQNYVNQKTLQTRCFNIKNRASRLQIFYKMDFTGNTCVGVSFFKKSRRLASLFLMTIEIPEQVFSLEIFRNNFFTEHVREVAFRKRILKVSRCNFICDKSVLHFQI